MGCSELVVAGWYRPSEYKGAGVSASGRGRGETRRRDEAVGDNVFGTEERGYNIAH